MVVTKREEAYSEERRYRGTRQETREKTKVDVDALKGRVQRETLVV